MQNRPSQYDWFKGKPNQKNSSDWKGGLKTTWKFTRIFLFFSIFFFSMWGCVQSFTTKTSPAVGLGTEVFDERDSVSPAVTTLNVTGSPEQGIYIQKTNNNIYFNGTEDSDDFKSMQNQFSKKGVKFLDDADGGSNNILRINDHVGNKNSTKYIRDFINPNEIAIASSLFSKVETTGTYPKNIQQSSINNLVSELNSLNFYDKKIRKNDSDPDEKFIPNLSFKLALSEAISIISNPKNIRTWNQVYNISIVNSILNNPNIKTFLASVPNEIQPKESDKSAYNNYLKLISSYNGIVANVTSILFSQANVALKATNSNLSNWSQVKFQLNTSYFDAGSGWNPVATWAQAFSMSRGGGPFYGIFVYPLAYVTNKIIKAIPFLKGWESLLSIVIVVVIVSLIVFLFSFKGTLAQQRMQELNAKKAVIEAKYSAYKGNKQMENRKRQEISEMYKKEGINPLSSLKVIFIQLPLFLAMWRIIGTNQHIKGTTWLGISFAAKSYKQLFAGDVAYLPILVVSATSSLISQLYPQFLTKRRDNKRINVHQKEALKKSNRTQKIMMIVFTFVSLIFTAGVQVYWIIRSFWKILESTATHNILKYNKKRKIRLGIK